MKKFFSTITIAAILLQVTFVHASDVTEYINKLSNSGPYANKNDTTYSKLAEPYTHVCVKSVDSDSYAPDNSVKISSRFPDEIDACVDHYKKTNKIVRKTNTNLRVSCDGKSEAKTKCLNAYEKALKKVGCDFTKTYCTRDKCAYSSENCTDAWIDKKCLNSSNPRYLDESKKNIVCITADEDLKKKSDLGGKYN